MKTLSATAACLLFMASVQAQQLEFKGVPMGASRGDFFRAAGAEPEFGCFGESTDLVSCSIVPPSLTYADQRVLSISGDFLNDRLVAVAVQTYGGTAGIVQQAITSKYGRPSKTRKSPKTRSNGTTYSSTVTEWHMKDGGLIMLEDHPAPESQVFVTLSSARKEAWFDRVNRASPKAKKDI
jgi:hypothetical protein